MAGMFLAGVQGMSAFAVGTIIVVAVAMLGSLTVLPAVLSCSATTWSVGASRSSDASAATAGATASGARS